MNYILFHIENEHQEIIKMEKQITYLLRNWFGEYSTSFMGLAIKISIYLIVKCIFYCFFCVLCTFYRYLCNFIINFLEQFKTIAINQPFRKPDSSIPFIPNNNPKKQKHKNKKIIRQKENHFKTLPSPTFHLTSLHDSSVLFIIYFEDLNRTGFVLLV